ncbi:hypothetical protein LRY65_05785 [Candidatus Woesebacteria bacterium]|nr:hypothetical protein [Candidatus Woesebacteria bacterium]
MSLENEDPFWNQLAPSHIGAERYAQIMYGALVTEYNQKIEKEKQEKALEQESKLLKFMELYGLSIAPPRTYSKRFQATVGEHYSYYQLMAAVPHLRNAISAPNEAIHDNAMREAKRLFTIQLFDQQIYERNVQSILAKIYNHIIMDEEQQALIKIELLSAWYREYLRAYNEGINTRYTS